MGRVCLLSLFCVLTACDQPQQAVRVASTASAMKGSCSLYSAWFTDATGTVTDLSATFMAGTASRPASYSTRGDGTLSVCDGVWYVTISSTHALTIEGVNGASATILDAAGTDTLISASGDLTLQGVTIRRADGLWGGGLYYGGSSLVIEESAFLDNTANYGEAIYASAANIEIIDSVFAENRDGRAPIYTSGAVSITIEGGRFSDNEGLYGGAVIVGDSGSLDITDTVFRHNEANYGTLYLGDSVALQVDGADFFANDAGYGEGIFIGEDNTVSIADTTFEQNEGGRAPIYVGYSSTVSVTSSDFINNEGSYGGGMVLGIKSTVNIDSSSFVGNTASYGGAIYSNARVLDVTSTDFSGNTSGDVWFSSTRYTYGTGASFICRGSACR